MKAPLVCIKNNGLKMTKCKRRVRVMPNFWSNPIKLPAGTTDNTVVSCFLDCRSSIVSGIWGVALALSQTYDLLSRCKKLSTALCGDLFGYSFTDSPLSVVGFLALICRLVVLLWNWRTSLFLLLAIARSSVSFEKRYHISMYDCCRVYRMKKKKNGSKSTFSRKQVHQLYKFLLQLLNV